MRANQIQQYFLIINTLNINCDTNINHKLTYEIKTQHIYDTKRYIIYHIVLFQKWVDIQ